jgi:site-specific DNA-methyltransferase (adenine-specific)
VSAVAKEKTVLELRQGKEKVQIVKASDIKPHPKNQSIYADEPDKDLIEDIEKRGVLEPLICEKGSGYIISGRRRYKAAKTIGIEFLPVIYREYKTENEIIESIIMHNAYRRKSERQIMLEIEALWDAPQEPAEEEKKSRKRIVYRRKSVDTISKNVGRTVSSSKVGKAVSIIKKAKSEMGENWQDHPSVQAVFKGKASINSTALNIRKESREQKLIQKAEQIINEGIDLRQQDNIDDIPNESVDHIITDPDYDGATGYAERLRDDRDYCVDVFEGWNSDLELDEVSVWCREWARVLKSGGNIAVFCNERYVSFIMEALLSNGFENPEVVVWHVTNPKVSGGGNRYEFVNSCRFIVIASMAAKQRNVFKWHGIKQMHNFIEGTNSKGKESYRSRGQLPQYVVKWLLERITNPGDVVLDNFAGTGSVGVACKKLKRNFILIEKNKKNIGIIKTRFAELESHRSDADCEIERDKKNIGIIKTRFSAGEEEE